MEPDELRAWLRLSLTAGVGPAAVRRLLAAFGLPQAVFDASHAALCQVVSQAQARALVSEPPALAAQVQATLDWLHAGVAAHPDHAAAGNPDHPDDAASAAVPRRLISWGDADYPAALLQTEDPPPLLYVMGAGLLCPGALAALGSAGDVAPSVAIVGSRNPTPQGASTARSFSRALAQAGLCVVSGMALGIDAAAHEGALDGAAAGTLATVAVVGTGLDRVYPRQHRALAHRIAAAGLLLSEFALGTPPLAANFPKRNRLIAALSRGTLVVEAALASGSLITARLASEQGREVLAIPGSIHGTQSRGCHALIKQGAKLVETAQDVLEELRLPSRGATPIATPDTAKNIAPDDGGTRASGMFDDDQAVLDALGADPASLDALLARTGLDTAALQARLLALELDGRVARLPGGLFQRMGLA